jgi:sirohydrochlorin ferrochelatase/(2Fe-2S) ferredoxin
MRTALLVLGHGSREARANADFEALVDLVRARVGEARRGWTVAHGYVELAAPLVDDALAALAAAHERVIVMPLFLFLVGHAKNDVPIALARVRQRFPHAAFVAARELGVHPTLLSLLFARAEEALPLPADEAARTAVVFVGRGSSDPDANAELWRLARLFGEGRGFAALVPAFIGIARPLVPDALEQAARGRPERLLVVPHLLFEGRLMEKLRQEVAAFGARYPWIRTAVAAPLGPAPGIADLALTRVDEALAGRAPLPCDTCAYRAPVSGIATKVGGLEALLWSVRHGYTHAQAAPHVHAHRPLRKHVLVCGNVDCADRGSVGLIEGLRRGLKAAGRHLDVRVTRTSCMGRCGEGPTVAVYPDGIWYRAVRPEDAEEIVREHLVGDRLVARLVDTIMQ